MEESFKKMGENLVRCKLRCEGVLNNPEIGALPRCLFFEKRPGKNGVIVVGLNPGHSTSTQRKYYVDNKCSYESTVKYWEKKKWKYFERVKCFLDLLGFDGPIIWTDLVKCECLEDQSFNDIPIQTKRVCIDRFLRKEIEMCPDYIILANGKDAFEFCSLSFPEKFIIGIPHSSGAWSKKSFESLIKKVEADKEKYMEIISKRKDSSGYFRTIYLKP